MRPTAGFPLRRFFTALLVLCTGVVCGPQPASSQTASQTLRTELDGFFTNILRDQQYVSLGACLMKDGRVAWEGYYGYADREEGVRLTRESIFPLMSLSKTVTAFALMTLHEQGLLDLDDDVDKYLPFSMRSPSFPGTPITFRMLLNHTSGLADVLPTGLKIPSNVPRPPSALGDSNIPLETYITELLKPGGKYYSVEYFNESMPGTQYSYSNIGYSLIGYLVERIAKQDFADYCNQRIFEPLGMKDTGWHLRDVDPGRVIFGYSFSLTDSIPVYRKVKHFGEPGYPAGMLCTTMRDFGRFIGVIMDNGRYGDRQVLKPETVELMLRPQGVRNIPSRAAKIIDKSPGWLIIDVDGSTFFTMNGFSGSMFSNAYFSPTERTCIIYYYTGINMKNMAGMPVISSRLFSALKECE